MAFSISAWPGPSLDGIGFEIQGVTRTVGDEGVIAVVGEQRRLGPGRGLHSPIEERMHRPEVASIPNWGPLSV